MMSLDYFEEKKQEFLEDLFEIVRIPSVTAEREEVKKATSWLKTHLKRTADFVKVIETKGNPVIIGEWKPQRKSAKENEKTVPTILFYGHYDVQPPEPLDKWLSPPFEPEIRDGRIYARGIGDNKGQFFAHLTAIECIHAINQLKIPAKFILDGDEELGSPHLFEAMNANKEFFEDVDLVLVSDGPADPSWKPTIEFGARGILTVRLELQSADSDVHSGNFGGIQSNPVWDIITILKTMRDDDGKCLIDGFYADVLEPSTEAQKAAEELKRKPEAYKKQLGISYFGGEQDQPLAHRVIFRPTFNIRGFRAGEVREKAKTIIPKEAVVDLDIRLVPNQQPEKVKQLFLKHLEGVKQQSERMAQILDRCNISFGAAFHPLFTPFDLPWTAVLEESVKEGFGEQPLKLPLAGGSLPLQPLFEITQKPIYIIPYAQPDEGNHAPNENMMVTWFEKGVKTSILLLEKLSSMK
ncbi:MAG: M20/M25/M40 family metallo-hydrolase [Candidatus Heimdallarchaeota archaeon]|nr:M20/M25/M40 family metallo-hydrolase [Candidatus Heimdallarchaeota archaeon]